jgi:hypothetical protein
MSRVLNLYLGSRLYSDMKSILTEIVLLGESIVFWAMAIPAAMIVFPTIAFWEKAAGSLA